MPTTTRVHNGHIMRIIAAHHNAHVYPTVCSWRLRRLASQQSRALPAECHFRPLWTRRPPATAAGRPRAGRARCRRRLRAARARRVAGASAPAGTHPSHLSGSPFRVTCPSHLSESPIRVTCPSHLSEPPFWVTFPSHLSDSSSPPAYPSHLSSQRRLNEPPEPPLPPGSALSSQARPGPGPSGRARAVLIRPGSPSRRFMEWRGTPPPAASYTHTCRRQICGGAVAFSRERARFDQGA
jgi:hypothetical protein